MDRHTNEKGSKQTDKKSEPFDTRSCQDRALALGHATDTRPLSWAELSKHKHKHKHRRWMDASLQCKAKAPCVYLPLEDPLTSRTSCHGWRDLWDLTVFTPHSFRGTQKTKRRVQTPATWSSQITECSHQRTSSLRLYLSSSSPCLNQDCVALPWIKWSVPILILVMVMARCGCTNCRMESSSAGPFV